MSDFDLNRLLLSQSRNRKKRGVREKKAKVVRSRGNIRCYIDRAGMLREMAVGTSAPPGVEVFDSKLEALVWLELCRVFGDRNVKRQASFPLVGGRTIRPDFLILRCDKTPLLADAKGRMEKDWAVKKDQFEGEYGWEIHLIQRVAEVRQLAQRLQVD